MRRHTRYALASVLVLVFVVGLAGAGWAVPNPYVSTVSRAAPMAYSNELTAVVTQIEGGWHYEYTLVYAASANGGKLASFSIANIHNLAFSNQGSSDPSFQAAPSTNSVLWTSGTVPVGTTVKFWFDSVYSYGLVNVTLSGGLPSSGQTLGMVPVPEPASIIAIAFGMIGALPLMRRKR